MPHPTPRGQSPYRKLAIFIAFVLAATFISNGSCRARIRLLHRARNVHRRRFRPQRSGPENFFRHLPLRIRTYVLRHLPQSHQRLRAAQWTCRAIGGPDLDRQGARSVPSLRYVLNRTPIWNKDSSEIPQSAPSKAKSRPRAASAGMAASTRSTTRPHSHY